MKSHHEDERDRHDRARPLVVRAVPPEGNARVIAEHLWQLYRYDLSAGRGELPGLDGRFDDPRIGWAFTHAGWACHLATLDGHPVGLALTRPQSTHDGTSGRIRVISAFFVVRAARRDGIGRRFAASVMSEWPGDWELCYQTWNEPAQLFWRGVAESRAPGVWGEEPRLVPGVPATANDVWVIIPGLSPR
jgi:predicted acetyltransferase